jgi:hypothetical protein
VFHLFLATILLFQKDSTHSIPDAAHVQGDGVHGVPTPTSPGGTKAMTQQPAPVPLTAVSVVAG